MTRVLIDVDGVVADLMGGFETFIRDTFRLELRPRESTTFHIAKSPAHQELHRQIDLDAQFVRFMALPNVYQEYVGLIPGSQEGVLGLVSTGVEVAFVTATLHESPESYASKYRWLTRRFGRVPVISCPANQKHWFRAHFGIDDRFDTCARWASEGVQPLLFRQPWNEAPEGTPSYDWEEIRAAVVRPNAA